MSLSRDIAIRSDPRSNKLNHRGIVQGFALWYIVVWFSFVFNVLAQQFHRRVSGLFGSPIPVAHLKGALKADRVFCVRLCYSRAECLRVLLFQEFVKMNVVGVLTNFRKRDAGGIGAPSDPTAKPSDAGCFPSPSDRSRKPILR